jgi:hypothetical protein
MAKKGGQSPPFFGRKSNVTPALDTLYSSVSNLEQINSVMTLYLPVIARSAATWQSIRLHGLPRACGPRNDGTMRYRDVINSSAELPTAE